MLKGKSVLVFDSGIGGLTVVDALRKAAPQLNMHYVADNAAFPYGRLSDEVLFARVCTVLSTLLERLAVDAVVIACNTVSTAMLDRLRAHFMLRIFGVVPPIKPAAQASRTRAIGLLTTPATMRQAYVEDLIVRFARDCTIVRIASSELARYAEKQVRQGLRVEEQAELAVILQPLSQQSDVFVDAVALGCTHYPFLLEAFKKHAPNILHWFDPAPAVARHVTTTLKISPEPSSDESAMLTHGLYFTADPQPTEKLISLFARLGFAAHTVMPLSFGMESAICE